MMALCDGTRLALLASSEDHKAVGDGDVGPNTGGMGTVSPSPLVDDALAQRMLRDAVRPDGARADRGGPAVPRPALRRAHADARSRPDGHRVELPLRRSRDAVGADALRRRSAALAGGRRRRGDAGRARRARARAWRCAWCWPPAATRPSRAPATRSPACRRAATIWSCSTPGRAGTATARCSPPGGRVLGVTAYGADLTAARARAYGAIEGIRFDGIHFRRDIGLRGSPRT